MKKADAIIQTAAMVLCAFIVIIEGLTPFLLPFIGIYQLVSSLIAVINVSRLTRRDRMLIQVYWLSVGIYFGVLSGLIYFETTELLTFWLFVLPWLFAIYCTIIAYLRAFAQNPSAGYQRGRFLNNIDF